MNEDAINAMVKAAIDSVMAPLSAIMDPKHSRTSEPAKKDPSRSNPVTKDPATSKAEWIFREKLAETIAAYAELHDFAAVVPTAAKTGKNVEEVIGEAAVFLAPGEWMFESDDLTDQHERQIASEVIREKLLRVLNDEIPHGIAVSVEEFTEENEVIKIRANIYCEKNSHKGIIVGKGGETLKKVGTFAREDLEEFFGVKVFLDLWVKVKENWRDSDFMLGSLGYDAKDID